MGAIEIPFHVGESYWLPITHGNAIEIPCPVCAGHLRITLTLGDGEQVSVPCEGCGLGYDGPRGYVREYRYEPGASLVRIDAIESMRDGKWRVSTSDKSSHDFDELCASEQAALEKSAAMVAEAWEQVMASHCRKRKSDKVGWTVLYHRQQIAELKKKIEWHEEKVQATK